MIDVDQILQQAETSLLQELYQQGAISISVLKAFTECAPDMDSVYITFSFYRPRTLNRFRGQGAPIGRLGSIGRNIFFIIFPVTFKGDSSFANRL